MVQLLFLIHPHRHGWRWAIMRATETEMRAEPTSRCVNAGFADTCSNADLVGQLALYTVLSFAQGIGVRCDVTPLTLDADPLPVQTDQELFNALVIHGDGQVIQIGV